MIFFLSYTSAQAVALFVQSVLYGFNLISLYHAVRVLVRRTGGGAVGGKPRIHWQLLIIAILLGLFATANIVFLLRNLISRIEYFVGDTISLHTVMAFDIIAEYPMTPMLVAQIIIGDIVLIYRCLVVYNKRWIMVMPSIVLWLAMLASGIVIVYQSTGASDSYIGVPRLLEAVCGLTLALNILTTSLTVWKIWSVEHQSAKYRGQKGVSAPGEQHISKLTRIIRILIDSAGLYTISVLIFVVTFELDLDAALITSESVTQIMGISFNLIIIRVKKSTTNNPTNSATLPWQAPPIQLRRPISAYHISDNADTVRTLEIGNTSYDYTREPVQISVSTEILSSRDYTSSEGADVKVAKGDSLNLGEHKP